jgi:Uma2 family endonuclease
VSRELAPGAQEYLDAELASPYRREYVAGLIYPLHGTTPDAYGSSQAHNLIGGNIVGKLHSVARQQGFTLYAYQLKLYDPSGPSFYYPDVMVTRPKPWPEPDAYFDTAPYLLIEITSEDSAQRDKGPKVAAYTALPSLQTYLIVEQEERRVYAHQKSADGAWTMQELIGEGQIDLACLGRSLSLD